MKPYRIKSENVKSIDSLDMKLSAIISNKTSSSYKQPYADLTKWILLKSPETYSQVSQFTEHMSSKNIEGDILFQPQKWWDANIYNLYQPLSANKNWPAYE